MSSSGEATKATGARGGLFGAGGRFKGGTDPVMEKFNESLSFDKRMWSQDITGSIAYAKATTKVGILTQDECDAIVSGLEKVAQESKHIADCCVNQNIGQEVFGRFPCKSNL